MPNPIDYTGFEDANMRVLRLSPVRLETPCGHRLRQWESVCKHCGKPWLLLTQAIGRSTSCLCRKKAFQHSSHPLYRTWQGVIERCTNTKNKSYPDYGGRGITVCNRWRLSFPDFVQDMGPKPAPSYQIERKNNNGNYEPDNCKWATQREQACNRRSTIWVQWNGRNLPLKAACAITGEKYKRAHERVHLRGWTANEAVAGRRNKGVAA